MHVWHAQEEQANSTQKGPADFFAIRQQSTTVKIIGLLKKDARYKLWILYKYVGNFLAQVVNLRSKQHELIAFVVTVFVF